MKGELLVGEDKGETVSLAVAAAAVDGFLSGQSPVPSRPSRNGATIPALCQFFRPDVSTSRNL
jgi:hypothetical protein|tara:strand:- start:4428 stop:4616 length:189 start_codon:yes stop_codon:yes gene_type:complete